MRPYRHGDELRRVHWRSTARHDELMVRLEERPWRAGTTVLLDRRDGAHRGRGADSSLEFAVSMAASVCAHLIGRGEPVDLVTEDGTRAARPARRLDPMLDALAALRPSARADLTGPDLPTGRDVVAVLGAVAPRATGSASGPPPEGRLRRAARHRDVGPGRRPPRQRGRGGERAAQRGLDRGRRRGGQHPRPGMGRAVKRRTVAIGGREPGVATLLASAPLGAIIQGWTWLGDAALAAAMVVALGLALHRLGPLAVVVGQCRRAARAARRPLRRTRPAARGPRRSPASRRWPRGRARRSPPASRRCPRHPRSSSWSPSRSGRCWSRCTARPCWRGAPAAAGVPLLAVFAVPAALDDSLLPWQAVVFAAAGFGVLLVLRDGARSQRLGGVVLVAVAVVAALGVGAAGTFVGTAGRFAGAGAGGERRDRPQPVHHAARAAHAGAAHRAVPRCAGFPSPPTCVR